MTPVLPATMLALPARTAGQNSPGQAPGDAGDLFSLLVAGLFPNAEAAPVAQVAGAEAGPGSAGFPSLLPSQLAQAPVAADDAKPSPEAPILPLASDDLRSVLPTSPGQAAPRIAPLEMPDGSSRPTQAAPILAMPPSSSSPSSLPPIGSAAPAADPRAAVADGRNVASIETAPRTLPATARLSPQAAPARDGPLNVGGDEAVAATSPKPTPATPVSLATPARTDAVGEEPVALPSGTADPASDRADPARPQTPSPRAGLVQVLAPAEAASASSAQVRRIDETVDRSTMDGRASASLDPVEMPAGRVERATSDLPAPPARPHLAAPALQIGYQILRAATHRVERMLVQLEPAALGRVEVRLDFSHEGKVSALIATDRPETLDVLQRDARSLERSLEQAGLRLDSGGLSFALKRDGGHGQPSADLPWSELPGDANPEQPGVDHQAGHGSRPAMAALRLLDLQV